MGVNPFDQPGVEAYKKWMFEALGKRVIYLKRISMGPLKLPDDLKTGTYRALTQAETDMLMQIKSGK